MVSRVIYSKAAHPDKRRAMFVAGGWGDKGGVKVGIPCLEPGLE